MIVMWLIPVLLTPSLSQSFAVGQGGSCVTCHREAKVSPLPRHSFSDWEASAHARAGVSCEACHGGDSTRTEPDRAHQGMLPSMDKKSGIYYTNIPQTCGACHQEEFSAFRKSVHYRELMREGGRGPNCVTCHGSMASHVMAPAELENMCSMCHRKPTQAFNAIMTIGRATAGLRQMERALAQGTPAVTDDFRSAYKEVFELHKKALIDWHSFKMSEVLAEAGKAERRASSALQGLKLQEQKEKP